MVVLIDNHGSCTHNLYQMCGSICPETRILDFDGQDEIRVMPDATHIIVTPGPDLPSAHRDLLENIRLWAGSYHVLGIGFGHLAICEAFGASSGTVQHYGSKRKSRIHIANGSPLFHGLPPMLEVGRFGTRTIARASLPDELLVIAEGDDGQVMGVKHRDYDIYGLQFHPQSILTMQGKEMVENFIRLGGVVA